MTRPIANRARFDKKVGSFIRKLIFTRRTTFAFYAALFVAMLAQVLIPPLTVAQGFESTGSMIVPREGAVAVLLKDGTVLITGGITVSEWDDVTWLSSAEIYDPNTGTFSQTTGPMGVARYGHTATLLADGKVLIAGGSNGANRSLDTAEVYDPESRTFTAVNAMHDARIGHSATLLKDGRVLMVGGWQLTTAELYDPVSLTFTQTDSLDTKRSGHAAVLLPDGKVLVAGGYFPKDVYSVAIVSALLYDPTTELFTNTGPMTEPRAAPCSALLLNGKALIMGGNNAEGGDILSTGELYDPVAGIFVSTGSLNTGRDCGSATATLLQNGMVLIAGGDSQGGAELYDPDTEMFSPSAPMAQVRWSPTATALPNGTALIAGGDNDSGSTGSAEIFRMDAPGPTLQIKIIGNGHVYDTSDYGLWCQGPGTCDWADDFSSGVHLNAQASAGWKFSNWSGDCEGTIAYECRLYWSSKAFNEVTATFVPTPVYALSVTLAGSGSGSVSSGPDGITCPSTCSASYNEGTLVDLAPLTASGSVFAGWSGACTGTGTCQVTMTAAQSATATFNVKPGADVSVNLTDLADPISAGSDLTYRITVANAGPDTATAVVLTDTLPAGVTFVSATPPQGSCASVAGGFSCALGNISSGTSISFDATVNFKESGMFMDTITVAASLEDSDLGNNSDAEQTLAVGVSVAPDVRNLTITAGQPATFAFTVMPDGGTFTKAVVFSCSVPAQMLYATCSFSPASVIPNSGPATANLVVSTRNSQAAHRGTSTLWLAFWIGWPGLLFIPGRSRTRIRILLVVYVVLAVSTVVLVGCGGSGSAVVESQTQAQRTPAGTYTVSVSATSGTFNRTSNVSVTVQ